VCKGCTWAWQIASAQQCPAWDRPEARQSPAIYNNDISSHTPLSATLHYIKHFKCGLSKKTQGPQRKTKQNRWIWLSKTGWREETARGMGIAQSAGRTNTRLSWCERHLRCLRNVGMASGHQQRTQLPIYNASDGQQCGWVVRQPQQTGSTTSKPGSGRSISAWTSANINATDKYRCWARRVRREHTALWGRLQQKLKGIWSPLICCSNDSLWLTLETCQAMMGTGT